MKANEEIKTGERFKARISRKLVPVTVERIEDRTSPTKRTVKTFIVRNEETGRIATLKSKRRLVERLPAKDAGEPKSLEN